MTKPTITSVNVYRHDGQWCYAAWSDGEYDHSDTLDADTEREAKAEVVAMFSAAALRVTKGDATCEC